MKQTKSHKKKISVSEIANLLDVKPSLVKQFNKNSNFFLWSEYKIPSLLEQRKIVKEARQQIKISFSKSNKSALLRWEKGWNEILNSVKNNGIKDDLLIPQYFQKHKYVRYGSKYIQPKSKDFEHQLNNIIRKIIFKKFLSGSSRIIDFGCGTGTSILALIELFPKLTLIGCDWSKAAVELINLIGTEKKKDVRGMKFDMFHTKGKKKINLCSADGIITMHSMEQLGTNFEPFLNFIVEQKPRICVHLEPIFELYDRTNSFDKIAIDYHLKRNYLRGFLTKLKKLQKEGIVKILEERRLLIGNFFHDHSSLVVWRPIKM